MSSFRDICQFWTWMPTWLPSSNLAAKLTSWNILQRKLIGHVLKHVIYSECKKNKEEQNSKELCLCLALDMSVHSQPPAKHNSQLSTFSHAIVVKPHHQAVGLSWQSRPPQACVLHWRSLGRSQSCYWPARSRTTTGREGEGGRRGEYDGECLFGDNCDNDEYDNNNKTTTRKMGRGCTGERTTGGNPTMAVATSSTSYPLVAWGIEHW